MKKKHSDFPWYLIYTPIITVIIMLWYWKIQMGVGIMDILEAILEWFDVNHKTVASLVIIAIALIALYYTISKMYSTNKAARDIKKVVDTAPENITEYVDSKHKDLSKTVSDASNHICQTIYDDKIHFAEEIATIKTNVGSLVSQRPTVPVQQSQLLSEINSLYASHDRDQATINRQKERINELETQNAYLKHQNAHLQKKLDELTPKQEQGLTL